MYAEGKSPNDAASSSNRTSSPVYHAIARSLAAIASGIAARIRSRVSASSGASTPPGTIHDGWIRLPPSHSITCWPKRRIAMPSRASRGAAAATPNRLRPAASASNPNRRSGEARWKKLSAFDWAIWARFMTRRRSAPAGGGSTAMISSHALAEATRWLTGQMPQMRAMIEGISWSGRPWTIRSKPRNWVTWNWASRTSPASSRWIVIFACPSIRVTGSMTIRSARRRRHRPNLAPVVSGVRPSTRSRSTRWMRSADGGQPGR